MTHKLAAVTVLLATQSMWFLADQMARASEKEVRGREREGQKKRERVIERKKEREGDRWWERREAERWFI